MAAKKPRSKKGAATRDHVYRAALSLFRKRGYEQTTMRAIAEAADLSLGAAYHYFPSKDAIVMAYYEETQEGQEAAIRAAVAGGRTTSERLDSALQAIIDVASKERRLLGMLFGAIADPHHPLSPFSTQTTRLRDRRIALFEELLADEPKSERRALARQLWLAHLALLLCLLYDSSADRAETRSLARDLAQAWPVLRSPIVRPFVQRVERVFGV